jgi:hypothetical protein
VNAQPPVVQSQLPQLDRTLVPQITTPLLQVTQHPAVSVSSISISLRQALTGAPGYFLAGISPSGITSHLRVDRQHEVGARRAGGCVFGLLGEGEH